MTDWTEGELAHFTTADDLHVSPYRADGRTPGTPTWIWSVVVDRQLYVRAYNGTGSRWYQAAAQQGAGQITTGGQVRDVRYVTDIDPTLTEAIDDAYRRKYDGSAYLPPMLTGRAVHATVRIEPAD